MKKDIIYFIFSILAVYLISLGIDHFILIPKSDGSLKSFNVELIVPHDQNKDVKIGRNIFIFEKKTVKNKIKEVIKKKKITKIPHVVVPVTKPFRTGDFRGLSLSAIYIKEKIKQAIFILDKKVYKVQENSRFDHFVVLNITSSEVELMDVNNRVKKKMRLK